MGIAERKAYQAAERAALAEHDPESAAALADEVCCRECGCSHSIACPDGCGWAQADLCTACAEDLEGIESHARETLLAVASYAATTLKETDGMWPPAARATRCRRALEHIEAECRCAHAAVTTDEGASR